MRPQEIAKLLESKDILGFSPPKTSKNTWSIGNEPPNDTLPKSKTREQDMNNFQNQLTIAKQRLEELKAVYTNKTPSPGQPEFEAFDEFETNKANAVGGGMQRVVDDVRAFRPTRDDKLVGSGYDIGVRRLPEEEKTVMTTMRARSQSPIEDTRSKYKGKITENLTKLFMEEVSMLNTIRNVREHLITSVGVDIPTLIRVFDPSPKGFITRDRFFEGVAGWCDLQVAPLQEELFVRRYFKNALSIGDLLYVLLGIKKDEADQYMQIMRARYGHATNTGENKTLFLSQLSHLLQILFECEEQGEDLRRLLFNGSEADVFEAFCLVDTRKDGVITLDELTRFMPNLTADEIGYLFYRLDKNKDGKVGYIDFILEITPIHIM